MSRKIIIWIAIAAVVGGASAAGFAGEGDPGTASSKSSPVADQREASKNSSQQGQVPQGEIGPLETGSGGAPAASPQGETPPGMQAAPSGSKGSTSSKDPGVTTDQGSTSPREGNAH